MVPFDFQPRTRVVFGQGTFERLGHLAREYGIGRVLLVADSGLVEAGHVAHAMRLLEAEGIATTPFTEFGVNPDSAMAESGRAVAARVEPDSIIGLGGGSSLDCAKAIN